MSTITNTVAGANPLLNMPDPPPAVNAPELATRSALSGMIGLRRVADKTRRRVKKLIGKADNTPWVVQGKNRPVSREYVDFMFALDYLSPNAPLVHMFKEAFAPYGLNLLLVNNDNIDRVIKEVDQGWLRPHVILDLASSSDRRIDQLCRIGDRQGVYTVGKPSIVEKWGMKAPSQPLLEAAGMPVPPTVLFWRNDPDRDLTPEEIAKVGEKVVVKPSHGVASLGVVIGADPTAAAIGEARNYNRNYDWLVQKKISWTKFGDRQAYVRSYNIFGHRSLVWWCKENGVDKYDLFTWKDLYKYDLLPVLDITNKLADLCGLDYFSSEIAITKASGPDRFVLIDYINDQCDLDPESGPGKVGIPEAWSRWVCEKCAEFVYRIKHGLPAPKGQGLHLF